MLAWAWVAGGCSAAATEAAPDAGTTTADLLADRLDPADTKLRTRGYSPAAPFPSGFLIEGKADVNPITLRAGRCRTFIAAASEALLDLELLLFDDGGREVARAVGMGAHPVLQYCSSRAGTHYFVVRAARGNGLYSTRIYDSPPGLAATLDDLFGTPAREGTSRRGSR